jgi:single-stranded DNA-binding protein
MNLLVLSGNLTRDFTMKGSVAKSCLALQGRRIVMYVDLVAFNKGAENCVKYNHKGDLVVVEGSLDISRYNDKNYISCVVNKITTLSAKQPNGETPIETTDNFGELDEPSDIEIDTVDDVADDDLPF